MKISCNQQNLAKTLSIVSRALGSRQLPILESILITADTADQTITCAATNLEIAIKMTVAAEVKIDSDLREKQLLLPGKKLTDIVHSFSSGRAAQVEINTAENGNGATIKCGRSTFKLPVAPVSEFPEIKQPSGDGFTVPVESFVEAVKQTIYATDPKDTRPFAQSVFFDIDKEQNKITLAGTDVNRLVVKSTPIKEGVNAQIMVPSLLLRKVVEVVAGTQVQFYIANNQLFATFGEGLFKDSFISVRMLDGQYPRYQQLFPTDFAGQLVVDRAEIIQVLERASLIDSRVVMQMTFIDVEESKFLRISSTAEGGDGQFQEEIEIIKHSGEPKFLNGFQVRYLLEFLKSISTEAVEINYNETAKPIVMQGNGDESCRYVCMPLRLPANQSAAA